MKSKRLVGVTHPALPAMANEACRLLSPPHDFTMLQASPDELVELFLIDADTAIYVNPAHWLHGSLFRRLDDGRWNYVAVLERASVPSGSLIRRMPAPADKHVH
jgi:hypothetical protein